MSASPNPAVGRLLWIGQCITGIEFERQCIGVTLEMGGCGHPIPVIVTLQLMQLRAIAAEKIRCPLAAALLAAALLLLRLPLPFLCRSGRHVGTLEHTWALIVVGRLHTYRILVGDRNRVL